MTVQTKYSPNYWAVRKRIQRLPKQFPEYLSAVVKRDIVEINKLFHDGIKFDKLNLEPLKDSTIFSKMNKNYTKPKSPLYGAGDDEKPKSYSSMMNIKKLKKAWKLAPSRRKHHESDLSLKQLFQIHENGATIKKETKKGLKLIKIPSRPALLLAYKKWLRQRRRSKKETSREVHKVLSQYIKTGKQKYLDILQKFDKESIQ